MNKYKKHISVVFYEPMLSEIQKLMKKEGFHTRHEFSGFIRDLVERYLKLKSNRRVET